MCLKSPTRKASLSEVRLSLLLNSSRPCKEAATQEITFAFGLTGSSPKPHRKTKSFKRSQPQRLIRRCAVKRSAPSLRFLLAPFSSGGISTRLLIFCVQV